MNLKVLAFLMTDRCNASCGMCCFSCTPHNRALLDEKMVKDYIRQAAELGTVETISFSGGEAILYYDQLRACVACANEHGFKATLVSNGFWAADMEKGRGMLRGLVEAGLTDLSLSVDQFHQEFVPIESVKNAMRLAEEMHILSAITLMDLKDGVSAARSMDALRPLIYGKNLIVYPTFPAGAALDNIPDDQFIRVCAPDTARCPYDNGITVLFDGSILMCCSQFSREIPPVRLGRFGETSLVEAIRNFNDNPFLYVMFADGFGFYAALARKLGFPVDEYYSIPCHVCHELLGNPRFLEAARPAVEAEANRLRLAKLLGR